MKKFLVVLLACAMIFGFASTALAADTQIVEFSDIKDQSVPVKNAIMKLAVLGVLEGNEGIGGSYRPGDTLTRAEFAKIVCYLTGNVKLAESLNSVGSKFSDVSTGNWYTGWVNAAAQSGYFIGRANGTFGPNANITMQEVVTVALRAAGYNDKLGKATGNTVWPGNYISKAMAVGLLDDVEFVGSAAATRADMAVICEAVLGINMVVHIDNEIAYALALSDATVDPDGYTEVYYLTNETNKGKDIETILHKAFKGEYFDVQVEAARVSSTVNADGVIDPEFQYDESHGWSYADFATGELALNVLGQPLWDGNKKFEDIYDVDAKNNPIGYFRGEDLASTYYITRDFDLTELAGMQVQVTVIDKKEIAFVDVVSSYLMAGAINLDRSAGGTAQNIMVDEKAYRPSITLNMDGKIANVIADGDYANEYHSAWDADKNDQKLLLNLGDSDKDNSFPGKVYLDKDGRIYGVKNYNAYDETSFGVYDKTDSNRAEWKYDFNKFKDDMKLEANKNYTLYKGGEMVKAEDLEENDIVSYVGNNGAPFFIATTPQEGELTNHNKVNNKLTVGGTAYRVIHPNLFAYSDDGGDVFVDLNLGTTDPDFGEVIFGKAYNFSKIGYLASNVTNQKVIGVITNIEPKESWSASSGVRQNRYEEITIFNREGKEVTYKFHSDFRDGYTWHVINEGFYSGVNWKTPTNGDTKWAAAIKDSKEKNIGLLKAGDIIELVVDKSDAVKRIGNYAKFEISSPSFEVKVSSANSRLTVQNGNFTVNSDTVVFNLSVDDGDYDDVSLQTIASVLAKDFTAAKAIAFDVKSGARADVLYIIGDTSAYQFGILDGWGNDGDYYYMINGKKVYSSTKDKPTVPSVVSYQVTAGEATLTGLGGYSEYLADENGYYDNIASIVALANDSNMFARGGKVESYSSGTKALEVGKGSYVYITSDTYIYDLVEDDTIDVADLKGKTVVAFYDKERNAYFVANVGSGNLNAFTADTATVTATALNIGVITAATSDDEGVATVTFTGTGITITSKSAGKATITVTDGTKTAKVGVTVKASGAITTEVIPFFATGTEATVDADVALGLGTVETVRSSNTAVATAEVSVVDGKTITIKPVSAGTATVTVTDIFGRTATINVTVDAATGNATVTYGSVINLSQLALADYAGEAVTLKVGGVAAAKPVATDTIRYAAAESTWDAGVDAGAFKAAGSITATITLTAKGGYTFTGTDIANTNLAGKLQKASSVAIDGTPGATLVIKATYTLAPAVVTVANAAFTAVPPADGVALPTTAVTAAANCTAAATTWQVNNAGTWEAATGTAATGKTYRSTYVFTPNTGYKFDATADAYAAVSIAGVTPGNDTFTAVVGADGKLTIVITWKELS